MGSLAWYMEAPGADTSFQVYWNVARERFRRRSAYQEVLIVELVDLGPALFLDGVLQMTARDEFIYHEMLVHVPLLAHRRPRRVLVVGGGDGGTLREVLRHREVERVDLVEIDPAVVEACRTWLPEVGGDAWDDPRCRIHFADGLAFLARAPAGAYDVILVDCSDPGGPASPLYDGPFYAEVHRALADDGIAVQQVTSPFFQPELAARTVRHLGRLFPRHGLYLCTVPTYLTGLQGFAWGSKGPDLSGGPARPAPAGLRWYTPEVHRAAFALPPVLADLAR